MRPGIFALLVVWNAFPAAAQVTLTGSPAIDMPASATGGTVKARLKASAAANVNVSLSGGRLVNKLTKEVLPYSVIFDPMVFTMTAGETREIGIIVSGILFEGEAELDVLEKGERIGAVTITRAPFAISAVETEVTFHQKSPTAITLRNEGRSPYSFRWMMQIGVVKQCGTENCDTENGWSQVTIPPKDSVSISVTPPEGWFTGWFSEETKESTLWLALPGGLPKRAIKLKANIIGPYYPGRNWWTLILLVAGALFSLVVRHWVPNLQRKRDLKVTLHRIRHKIDGFSHDISPDLRVAVHVKWNLVEAERKSVWTIMPDYVTLAAQCTQLAAALEKRVDLIEEIDTVFQALREEWDKCPPPSQNDEIEDLLKEASERLKKTHCSESELSSIRQVIEQGRALTARMRSPDRAFGNDLAARLKSIREEMAVYRNSAAYQTLADALPGLFKILSDPAPDAEQPIPALRYAIIDYEIQALQICRDYMWLAADATDPVRQNELGTIRPEMIHHLVRKGWNDLRLARLLLKQFRENCSEEEVWKAVESASDEMFIVHDPETIQFSQLVEFRALFRRQDMNWSAARDLISPEWDFGDGTKARGWVVSHYYLDKRDKRQKVDDWFKRKFTPEHFSWEPHDVWVGFAHAVNGKIVRKDNALLVQAAPRPDMSDDRNTRTFNEAIGLVVSIAVPLLSLLAGAQKALSDNPTEGALTVFLLGYSSESILSVFKQRVSPTGT